MGDEDDPVPQLWGGLDLLDSLRFRVIFGGVSLRNLLLLGQPGIFYPLEFVPDNKSLRTIIHGFHLSFT